MTFFRKSGGRYFSTFTLMTFLIQTFAPTVSYALTSGPSQPEVQSFEPIGTTEMVDLFTGDFTYNIPLIEVPGPNGGYPLNLHYNAGINTEDEASWVGLGWNLNPGALTRQMRGLPDEFNNAKVKRESYIKPNVTVGVNFGASIEPFGAAIDKAPILEGSSLSIGLSVFYNNYKGVGYSVSPAFRLNTEANKYGSSFGVGLSMNLSSQEGVGANVNLSLSDKKGNKERSFNLGADYSSHSGLMGVSAGFSKEKALKYKAYRKLANGRYKRTNITTNKAIGSSISFAGGGYTPSIQSAMRTNSLSLGFQSGGSLFGVFGKGFIKGFYNDERLDKETENVDAFGYMYMNPKNGNDAEAMLDFNRSKDGLMYKSTPNLPASNITYDIYSMTGHGMAGMFRPYRNDVPVVHDRKTTSESAGGALVVEFAPGLGPHFGGDLSINYGQTISGLWDNNNNELLNSIKGASDNDDAKNFYFKMYGEPSYDDLGEFDNRNGNGVGNEEPFAMNLTEDADFGDYMTGEFKAPRLQSNGISAFDNNEKQATKISMGNGASNFEVTGTDGSTYVYGDALMVTTHKECQFAYPGSSAIQCSTKINFDVDGDRPKHKYDNTDQFFSRMTMGESNGSSYAHSYLLTGIKGADYVDADGISGISDGDLGYWVKFTYTTATDYNYRMPFFGASYSKGILSSFADDKGSYVYGTKKIKYVSKIETKSHVAEFILENRNDAYGASSELQNTATLGAASKKLRKIVLYSKDIAGIKNSVPIKTVNFGYTEDIAGTYADGLCKNIPNASNPSLGKLTLNKLYFTFENNTRGALSPYKFKYNQNPNYEEEAFDRWGTYRPASTCGGDFPYTDQSNRTTMDQNAAAWSLSEITLPTGGVIKVDYEADDYAYVQNKVANQMFKISGVDGNGQSNFSTASGNNRVFFTLETPIASTETKTKLNELYLKNLVGGKLYFKVKAKLANNVYDYVSGYADIKDYGFDPGSVVNGQFTRGYIDLHKHVKGSRVKNDYEETPYHPFAVAGWEFMRDQNPDLCYASSIGSFSAPDNLDKMAKLNKVRSLARLFGAIMSTIEGFYSYCNRESYASSIELANSYIRLTSPDKIKVGGGVRVKKIELNDNWYKMTGNITSSESDSKYGQVYDYTMLEGGVKISSGVAAWEPSIGGDEIPQRVPVEFTEQIPLKTDKNMFTEKPLNEDLYPGPTVGYRKVMVMSIASYYANKTGTDDPYNVPTDILKSGALVHDFYTAKDFPVIEKEAPIKMPEPYHLFIPVPFIGSISVKGMSAVQSYCTILNDMHGKPKKMSTYKVDKNGALMPKEESSIEYIYNANLVSPDGNPDNNYYTLNNKVDVILGDDPAVTGVDLKHKKYIGQDQDFYMDMRKFYSYGIEGGGDLNVDLVYVPTFFFTPVTTGWPSASINKTTVRSAVANKVIHKTGILVKTITYDGGSKSVTENLAFDGYTGKPLLTRTNNNFDDPIYNYTIPSYFAYDDMGDKTGVNANRHNQLSSSVSSITAMTDPTLASSRVLESCSLKVDVPEEDVANCYILDNIAVTNTVGIINTLLSTDSDGDNIKDYYDSDFHTNNDRNATNGWTDPNWFGKKIRQTDLRRRSVYTSFINGLYQRAFENPILVPGAYIRTGGQYYQNGNLIPNNDPNLLEYIGTSSNPWQNLYNNLREDNTTLCPYYPDLVIGSSTAFAFGFYNNSTVTNPSRVSVWNDYDFNYFSIHPISFRPWIQNSVIPGLPIFLDRDPFFEFDNTTNNFNKWNPFGFVNYNLDVNVTSEMLANTVGSGFDYYNAFITAYNNKQILNFQIIKNDNLVASNYQCKAILVAEIVSGGGTVKVAFPGLISAGKVNVIKPKTSSKLVNIDISTNTTKLNNILGISASTMNDSWPLDHFLLKSEAIAVDNTGVKISTKNVWRGEEAYAYVSNRKSNISTSTAPNLRTDGTMDNVKMYNFKTPFIEQCFPEWRKTNTVTKYSPYSFELENKDILNVYSSAAYAYNGNMSTVVAGNTAQNELAFESFEEYVGKLVKLYPGSSDVKPTGNLIFATNTSTNTTKNMEFDIPVEIGQNNLAIVSMPYNKARATFEGQTNEGKAVSVYFSLLNTYNVKQAKSAIVTHVSPYIKGGVQNPNKTVLHLLAGSGNFDISGAWIGKISYGLKVGTELPAEVTYVGGLPSISTKASGGKAHTGKSSLKINAGQSSKFDQFRLALKPNAKYILNVWVSSDNTDVSTFGATGRNISLSFKDMAGASVGSVMSATVKGPVTNGWQQMELEFTVPANAETTSLQFASPSDQATYFDDIRIMPFDSKIQTYVYDYNNYRLQAVLDDNNYATLYYYDEEGKLYLVKKETERGIKTIKESFNHSSEN